MANKKKAQTQTGGKAIRAVFLDAQRAAEGESAFDDAPPDLPRTYDGQTYKPGQWPGAPDLRMPPDELVQVIGRNAAGSEYYFLTATGHFRTVTRFDGRTLTDLYAPYSNTLKFNWPAFGKKKVYDADQDMEVEKLVVKRVERDQAFDCLMNEAARKPTFDAFKQHRGRGGWVDRQGRFIWHSGDYLWSAGTGDRLTRARPAQHDGFLYTREARAAEPWEMPVTAEESPARRILDDLRTWQWERPYLDPVLLLGWVGTAIMGGALKARPVVFTTGGAGVGKSMLQELLKGALADIVTTSVNTTAAGIYQRAKKDSLPFMVDELESKAGSSRADAVIELARVAYTGGDISRGGADHEATSFTAQQSFLFSAINAPPMLAQDKSRMALLNLGRLDKANGLGRKVVIAVDRDGRMMLRQVIDGWQDFAERLLPGYWTMLSEQGLDSRAIDTFGTLLAAAELLVGPEALADLGLDVTEPKRLAEIVAAATALERAETLDNWHECLDHLFQSTIDQWRDGIKPTVGGVCELVRAGSYGVEENRDKLALLNLGMVKAGHVSDSPCLAVPSDGPALARVFAETKFHKGVWYSALKQAPADIVIRDRGNKQVVKINGSAKRCLLVDLVAFDAYAARQGER